MNRARFTSRGVTLTELLVVLVIIAILSTIAVPVYLNRVETAKIRTAQMEVRELAVAEDMCAAVHGVYVPLQMLDDMPTTTQNQGNPLSDDVQNYNAVDVYIINPALPVPASTVAWTQLSIGFLQFAVFSNESAATVSQIFSSWQGPFVNFHRFLIGLFLDPNTGVIRLKPSESDYDQTIEVKTDLPLDPWNEPYRFFSPYGLTGSPSFTFRFERVDWQSVGVGGIANLFAGFDLEISDRTVSTGRDQERPYDRWAIVSYGPNGVADDPLSTTIGANDDIVYAFGIVPPETNFNIP